MHWINPQEFSEAFHKPRPEKGQIHWTFAVGLAEYLEKSFNIIKLPEIEIAKFCLQNTPKFEDDNVPNFNILHGAAKILRKYWKYGNQLSQILVNNYVIDPFEFSNEKLEELRKIFKNRSLIEWGIFKNGKGLSPAHYFYSDCEQEKLHLKKHNLLASCGVVSNNEVILLKFAPIKKCRQCERAIELKARQHEHLKIYEKMLVSMNKEIGKTG